MVSNKGIYSSRSFWPLLGAITVATRETKAGPVSAYAHRGPTFDLASLNHIKPRQYRLAMPKPRTRLEMSQQRFCVLAKATSFSSCRSSSLPSSLS
jgi:hypothetical protein